VIYVFSHDSVWIGEDGPTHQPVEQLAALRAIPNLTVIRPADANETAVAWRVALEHRSGPVALILSRQGMPILDRASLAPAEGLARGGYILAEAACTELSRSKGGQTQVILIATGSEVCLALEARGRLAERGVRARVVSMPSWELFERQPEAYRQAVLPPEVTARLAVEAGVSQGWHHYVGPAGDVMGIERFGASAPYKVLQEKFGFTAESVAERALALLRSR